jgi:tetratricopeptide (TPR) repeat protein
MNPSGPVAGPSTRLLWLSAILSGLLFVGVVTILGSVIDKSLPTTSPAEPVPVASEVELMKELQGDIASLYNPIRYEQDAGEIRLNFIKEGERLLAQNPTSEARAVTLAGLYLDTVAFAPEAATVNEHALRMRLLVEPYLTPDHLSRRSFNAGQLSADALKYYAMSYRLTRDFTAGAEKLLAVRAQLAVPAATTSTLPSDSQVYGYLTHLIGYLYDMGGEVALARQFYTEATAYAWQYAAYDDTLIYLARLEQSTANPDVVRVRTLAEQILSNRPASIKAVTALAEADIMSGESARAVERLLALGDQRCQQHCAHVLVAAQFAQYQMAPTPTLLAAAKERAEAALIAHGNMAGTRYIYGQILAASGQPEEATTAWTEAQASLPVSSLPTWLTGLLNQKIGTATASTSESYYPVSQTTRITP